MAWQHRFLCGRRTLTYSNSTVRAWKASFNRGITKFAYPPGHTDYATDYTDKPEYPEINPATRRESDLAKERRLAKEAWYADIKSRPTVEEKNLCINIPRKYGWRCYELTDSLIFNSSASFYKFITRTHMVPNNVLPDTYSAVELSQKAKHYAQLLKDPILDALKFESEGFTRQIEACAHAPDEVKDRELSQSILQHINRIIINELSKECEHLKDCEVDYKPSIQAFWSVYGLPPSRVQKLARKGNLEREDKWRRSKVQVDDPTERNFHYASHSLLQLRGKQPVRNYVDMKADLCCKGEEIPEYYPYEPRVFQLKNAMKFATYIPGHWTGDDNKASLLNFYGRDYLKRNHVARSPTWYANLEEIVASQAVLASFARLLAQSMFYGFDQYTDLQYPFSTQTIITNGLQWSFFTYQLNTIRMSEDFVKQNTKQNICWGTKTMDIIDLESNTLNEDVLQTLLKFYLNPPEKIPVSDETPYLNTTLNDTEDEIHREVVLYNLRDMLVQRHNIIEGNLGRRFPEIYDWERIYKVKFAQRPMDKRTKFFELPDGFPGSDPYREPYVLRDPRRHFKTKGFKRLKAIVDAKKEEERVNAAKKSEDSFIKIKNDD